MSETQPPADDSVFVARALKVTIRVGVVLLLVVWCFSIVRPFLVPVVWGIVIAVATYRLYELLEGVTGRRRGIACAGRLRRRPPALMLANAAYESLATGRVVTLGA